jgi:hypothetical protein
VGRDDFGHEQVPARNHGITAVAADLASQVGRRARAKTTYADGKTLPAMIVDMKKAENREPDSLVDGQPDGEVNGTLPMFLTSFIGRERELDEIWSLLRIGKRLVTLVGIGGIGKTRLALELGVRAGNLGWTKAYLVELTSLANPGWLKALRSNR